MASASEAVAPSRARPSAGAPRAARVRRRQRIVRGAIGILGVCLLIEVFTRLGVVNPAFLPPFSASLVAAVELLGRPEFQADILATLQAWGIGLLIGIAVAVPVGLLLGLWTPAFRGSRAIIDLIRPIPSVALIPLAILLLGTGVEMKSALVVYAAVWPILFNTIYGVHDVDPVATSTARSFGMSRLETIRSVVLPSAAPLISAGIRVGAFLALMMVISTELVVGGSAGIGSFMSRVQASGEPVIWVFGATIIAGVIGFIINFGLNTAERALFRWQPQERGL